MEKEFVSYEIAIDLKELGFDEPCFGYFDPLLGDYAIMNSDCINPKPILFNHNSSSIVVSAPLYQQAFSWFREKYKLNSTLLPIENEWYFLISKTGETLTLNRPRQCYRDTYEEAELECLNKLIEIVKEKK